MSSLQAASDWLLPDCKKSHFLKFPEGQKSYLVSMPGSSKMGNLQTFTPVLYRPPLQQVRQSHFSLPYLINPSPFQKQNRNNTNSAPPLLSILIVLDEATEFANLVNGQRPLTQMNKLIHARISFLCFFKLRIVILQVATLMPRCTVCWKTSRTFIFKINISWKCTNGLKLFYIGQKGSVGFCFIFTCSWTMHWAFQRLNSLLLTNNTYSSLAPYCLVICQVIHTVLILINVRY